VSTLPQQSHFLIYQTEDGRLKIDVRFEAETVWLTQKGMAELFQKDVRTISEHLKSIFEEGELQPESVIRKFRITATDGKNYETQHYNLDVIISIGYRVRSLRGTQFRIWATQQLREFIVKGFVLDDERLKNPDQPFDYFEELLRRIQDIRTSERRFYQKITDIYATSIDYDPTTEESIAFFKTVQNKLHWAVTGMTAAELIHSRANSTKTHMGLTTWRGAKIRKQDIGIAKNYLNEEELLTLNNLVEQYLLFAERQALRRTPMHMADWIARLDAFLTLNEGEILTHAGKVSHELALTHAEQEYNKFHQQRQLEGARNESDFDKAVKALTGRENRSVSERGKESLGRVDIQLD
jgi:Virulence protein